MSEHLASRRAMLAGAGSIAAIGALSASAVPRPPSSTAGPSPELLAWRKARAACQRVWEAAGDTEEIDLLRTLKFCEREDRLESGCSIFKRIAVSTGCSPTLRAIAAAEVTAYASRSAVLHRPTRSFRDIAERVEVLRAEREWQEGRETYDRYIACPELDALFTAIETMAKGGTHV